MSTTTLRAYLDELDLLLQREALEEVIGHCRHILQHYPKNVETYQLLGKALLEKARYEEAAQVFPRLLSADPNDFVAHIGMSSIYENQQQLNQAVWHMERANEQMPNNNVILNELKRLYKRRDEAAPRKIQLTRAALAQQYLSSGMHEQAITELRRSLVEQPNRLDLRVRLATALWDAGHMLEAGELALEVLRVLPDCLPLNILMAKLWIMSRRPDDAKPFLEKVEALAPYESLRLIYSSDSQASLPEGAFVLSRLKWTADAASSVAGPAPDWISQITDVFNTPESIAPTRSPGRSTASQELPDWMSEAVSSAPADDLPDWFTPGADFGGKPKTADLPAPDDWFNEMASSLSSQASTPKTSQPAAPISSGEDELPDWFTDISETAPAVDMNDLFGDMPVDVSTEAPLPDWMAESAPSQKSEPVAPTPSWLDDAPDFTATESVPPARKSTGFTGLLAEIQQAEDEPEGTDSAELPDWMSAGSSTDDDEPPSIFGDVDAFSFGENPDEELEQLRAAARPPSAEEVAELLALGGRKPEEEEEELPDWLVEDSPPQQVANAPAAMTWDEETLFEDFGADSVTAQTPSWLSDASDEVEFTTLFEEEEETPDWLTDVSAQSSTAIPTSNNFAFESTTDDWLMGELESADEPSSSSAFQLDEEEPATSNDVDWLTDAVATDTPSLSLENVGQASVEEFDSLFEDELITPPPSAEKRLGVTGELPWRQGVSEHSSEAGSADEFAVLFDSQLPQQTTPTAPSRLGVTGELPWRQETDSDDFASPSRPTSLDNVDWNALDEPESFMLDESVGSDIPAEPIEPDEPEPVASQTPVDDLSAWLNVPPQTSSIAQEVSDDEFTDLFSDDLIPRTSWLDDVQQETATSGMAEFLSTDEDHEIPDWMRDVEPIQSVAPEVTDSELDAMFGSPVDDLSGIGEPSTGWLTELDSAPAADASDDWLSSFETPSAKAEVADTNLDNMFGSPVDDLSSIGEPSTGWLTELDSTPAADASDNWLSSFETPSAIASGVTVDLSEEINDDWLLSSIPTSLSNTLETEVSDEDLSNLFGDQVDEVGTPSTGWLDSVSDTTSQSFESAFDDLSDISAPRTGWLDDVESDIAEPESAADWLSSFGQTEPPASIPQVKSEPEFGSLFDDLSEIGEPHTGWLDDVEEGTAEPENAADWLSSFGQIEPPSPIPQAKSEPEFGSLFDDLSEIGEPRTGWLDDVEEGKAETESASGWLSSFGQTEPPAPIPQAEQFPDWLSDEFDDNSATETQAVAESDIDSLFGDLSEIGAPRTGWLDDVESNIAEPESASDWLASIGKAEPSAPIPLNEPAEALPDWLAGVEIEEEPKEQAPVIGFDDLFQDMSTVNEPRTGWLDMDEEEFGELQEEGAVDWTGDLIEELEEESAAPDWLSDDIRLDTSDIQLGVDFDERPARAVAKESEERKPASVDNIDAFLASITSADQKPLADQTEAMISELDQLTGFQIRELNPEEVEAATRPSSSVPTTLPEEFPDEVDFGFVKPQATPVATKSDLPDTNIDLDDEFPIEFDEPSQEKQKRGRRLFGKRKESAPQQAELEPISAATSVTPATASERPASFDFDRDPPWLRKQKGSAASSSGIDFDLDFGEDDDTPPDWFK